MIRINLLPQKRSRQVDRGQQSLLLGFLMLLVSGALVFFLVHNPLSEQIEALESSVKSLTDDTASKQKDLQGYPQLKKAVAAAAAREKVITRLNDARATPAHLLYELSSVLTSKRTPTMTKDMSEEISDNPNRQLSRDWDAKHIWITSFLEEGGRFTLEGGAQSDSDMTQLALRLQASVFFHEVVPEGGEEAVDKDSGVSFYKFTITGKVAY